MAERYSYRVGDELTDVARKWLLPATTRVVHGPHRIEELTFENGQVASTGDFVIYDDGDISIVSAEDYRIKCDGERCIECRHSYPCTVDPAYPVCLAGGDPDVWSDRCNATVDSANNRFDTYFERKDPSLGTLMDRAEWDMDRYARDILGKTDEEIDAQGDADCIHAWVAKHLLQCQSLIYEAEVASARHTAKQAVKKYDDIAAAIDALEIRKTKDELNRALKGLKS